MTLLTRSVLTAALLAATALSPGAHAADPGFGPSADAGRDKASADAGRERASESIADGSFFKPEEAGSDGSVTIGGQKIDYHAVVGTQVVHPRDWDDAPQKAAGEDKTGGDGDKNATAEAAMSFVAYFKKGAAETDRPLMFLYNGGPGSSTVWLHMGAFGPRRVVTLDDSHAPAAPYQLINNDSSLLDVADLVFVDAPGTGFGRLAGPNKEKAFWGTDQDAHAFAEFVTGFLTRYGRWNSPKYLFGESYGTTRSAVLVNMLETDYNVDVNGVVLLSQILNFDDSVDEPEANPATMFLTRWRCRPMPPPRGITRNCSPCRPTWNNSSARLSSLPRTIICWDCSAGLPCRTMSASASRRNCISTPDCRWPIC